MSAIGSPDATSSLALDANALSALREQAKTAPGKALSAAATQFEAVFLQMMLKSMRDATPQDGPLDSSATKMYTSMFDQQIAVTMAKRGTGLSKVIETQLARSLPKGVAESAKANAVPGMTVPAGAAGATTPAAAINGAQPVHATGAVAGARATPGLSAAAYSRNAAAIPMTTKSTGALPMAAPKPKAAVAAATTSWLPDSIRAFVDKLRPAAEAVAKAVGLPVQYLLAQAGLESGWGKHQPKDASGAASHNILGIKAGRNWTGNIVASATHEVVGGKSVPTQANFRSYDTYEASFRDFAKLLHGRRYAPALAQASDPAAYANALQKGGYATDPQYAAKLARAIRTVAPLVEAKATAPAQVSASIADNQDVRT